MLILQSPHKITFHKGYIMAKQQVPYTFGQCSTTKQWQNLMHGWVFYAKCRCGEITGYDQPKHFNEIKKVMGPYPYDHEWVKETEQKLNNGEI